MTLTAAGCGKAPYNERMKFLDGISQKGIDYRAQLYDQHTEPSKEAQDRL
ncbi:hypothetical protein V2I01_15275 [Micromonospora sp. BRA006-A]|nr:hypothetical protein [Micromonospora sp. BRA006-A]